MVLLNSQRLFTGFCTRDTQRTGINTFYDIDIVDRDLMAAFQTRVGERVGRPAYGCLLWNYVMEPLTPHMVDLVTTEVARICALDTRVQMQSNDVYQLDSGFRIMPLLLYVPWNVVQTFTMSFENRQNTGNTGAAA